MGQKEMLKNISAAVIDGEPDQTVDAVKQALDGGVSAFSIVEDGLTAGMDVVGEKFENKEYYLPDLLVAASSVKLAMNIIKPHLTSEKTKKEILVVMGTVEGDVHDIGKNLVINALEASSFRTIDLGVDVPAAKFVESVKKYRPDIVGCSALLSVTMINIEEIIDALQKERIRDQVKVMVGGAPLSHEYAKKIGADYYGETLRDAVIIAKTVAKEIK